MWTGLRIQVRRACRTCRVSSCIYPSSWQVLLRTARTARLKCAGTPTCMYHIRALTASSFGRSCKRKSRLWWPVSRCGKTCGPTQQSPAIPVHTLMLNCCWCLHGILSAITHKLNVSRHMLISIFFLVLVCGTRAQSLASPFNYAVNAR
jgi:hypothetical protein